MHYTCEIYDQVTQPVMSVRLRTTVEKLPEVIGESYGEIMQYLTELGEDLAGMPFVAYFNMDMENLDVEIGMPVTHALPAKGHIQRSELPSGKYAKCMHVGPYRDLGPAYEALNKYIQEHEFTPSGVAYEYYLNSPNEVLESEIKTIISFPLN